MIFEIILGEKLRLYSHVHKFNILKLEPQNQKLKNQLTKQFCEKCLAYNFFVI